MDISFSFIRFIGYLNAVNNRKEQKIASHIYKLLYSTKQSSEWCERPWC